MALSSYPFDGQSTTETDYSALFSELQDTGVVDSATGTGFQVAGDSTGMQVKVQPGFALLRGFAVNSTAVTVLPISAAASSARIDTIVLRLDPAQNSIVLAVVNGVAGSGVAPTLTQSLTGGIYEMPLANVNVNPGVVTITATDVTGTRRFVGHRVGTWKSDTTRPANPRAGKLGLNLGSGHWEYWDGTKWADLSPVVTWSNVVGAPTTFAPAPHRHDWNDLDNLPASFVPASHTHDWAQVTGKPTTFPPATHTHAYAPTSHTHSQYADDNHTHPAPAAVDWAAGSQRVRNHSPAGSGWYAAWVDGNDQFCHNTSSIRFKENVRDYPVDPADVLALRPRVYDRKAQMVDGEEQEGQKDEYGLIAEEVAETLPEIVVRDREGRIDSLRYDLLAVALLDVVKDQERRIAALEAQVGPRS